MIRLIEQYRDAIARLCKQFHVARLEVFGSAAKGDFNEQASDIDFLVELETMEPEDYADAYFGLLFALRELFKREVDLVTKRSIRNPYFREELEETGRLIYAA